MTVRISVVIPTYNLEEVACRTLASVLSQTSLPDEILIADDGSTDRTLALVQEAVRGTPAGLVRILPGPHRGPGATRNRGIQEATGDWVSFLDGDDLWLPAKMERLRSAIATHPEADIIAHDEFEIGLDGIQQYKPLHQYFDRARPLLTQLYRGCFLSTSCVAVRARTLREAGSFDEELGSAQDFDLWLRLARRSNLHFIPEPLEIYVLRKNNISSDLPLRYQCLRTIAFRHAPYLAPLVGRRMARKMQFHFLAMAQMHLIIGMIRSGRWVRTAALGLTCISDLARGFCGTVGETGLR